MVVIIMINSSSSSNNNNNSSSSLPPVHVALGLEPGLGLRDHAHPRLPAEEPDALGGITCLTLPVCNGLICVMLCFIVSRISTIC